jgi:hypothetical protein
MMLEHYKLKSITSLPATVPLRSFAMASGIFAIGNTSYMGFSFPLRSLAVVYSTVLRFLLGPQIPALL